MKPLRGYCLIQLIEEEVQSDSGLFIPDAEKERKAKGRVLALGNPPYLENGKELSWEVKEGEIVWFKRFAGEEFEDKKMLVRFAELLAVE